MKSFFKQILKYYLKYITKLVLFFRRPVIIAVAGSTNKTFVRDEIRNILEKKGFRVRANPRSFNTEIGLPLAILNLPSGYNSYRNWLPVIKGAALAVFQKNFPDFLVLELGVSQKGDMRYLLSIVKPKISVITNITQRYIESFSGMDSLTGEYKYLAKNTQKDGLVIINRDNSRAKEIAGKTSVEVNFYGKNEECYARIKSMQRGKKGEVVEIKIDDKIKEEKLNRFGEHHAYARAAAILVDKYIQMR